MFFATIRIYKAGHYVERNVTLPVDDFVTAGHALHAAKSVLDGLHPITKLSMTIISLSTTSSGNAMSLQQAMDEVIEAHGVLPWRPTPKPGELLPVKPGTMDVDWDSYEKSKRPTVVAISPKEGTDFRPFETGVSGHFVLVHAIKFSDGWIWDTKNGWRDKK